MGVSNLVSTSEEREASRDALASTEQTDAVNSGIVQRADKSATALKPELFERSHHNGDKIDILQKSSDGKGRAAISGVSDSIVQTASEAVKAHRTPIVSSNAAAAAAHGLRSAMRNASRNAMKDSELEGLDDMAENAHSAVRGLQRLQSRLARSKSVQATRTEAGSPASSSSTQTSSQGNLGQLSEKRYRQPQSDEARQRAAQGLRNQMVSQQKAAASAKAAGTAAAGKAGGGAAVAAGAAKVGGSGLAAVFAPVIVGLLAILGILSFILLVLAIISGVFASDEDADAGGLTGNDAIVAEFLLDKGLDEVHVAAIMGNFYQESGMNPEQVQHGCGYCNHILGDLSPCKHQKNYPPELINDENAGYGLAQWSYPSRAQGLVDYAASKQKDSGDITIQLEYFWKEFERHVDRFNVYTDVDSATRWFHSVYEKSADGEDALRERVSDAQRYYDALTSGGNGEDYANANETQKRIVNACKLTPSPPANRCAEWVNNVYQAAGFARPVGNAEDLYFKYCHSSDRSELKVGMIVASPDSGYPILTESGWYDYGHVGIYVGDNKVMHSIGGSIRTDDLDEWIKDNSKDGTVGWGYPAKGIA